MPKQKKTPTEAQLRKARRKAMVERLFEAWEKNKTDTEFVVGVLLSKQKCPYTCIELIIYRCDDEGPVIGHSLGFSKCKWPDKFDADYGVNMAAKKAIAYIVKESGIADG